MTLAQTSNGAGAGIFAALFLVWLVFYFFYGYCYGRILQKAGQPLWAGFVPFYNIYLLLKISGRPGWWLILFFIPIVNIVIGIIYFIDLAKSFGKGTGFGVGLYFLWFIFIPILAFSADRYVGPAAAGGLPPGGYPPPGYPQGYPPPGYPPQGGYQQSPPPGQWGPPQQ